MSKHTHSSFASRLLEWHKTIDRNLPWKSTQDPYKIWLSEIIMQQTRVAQGTPYYLRFVEAFPTITDLANADESVIMKLWQGLGYYSRARNLHHAAKTVRDDFKGVFPNNFKDILSLKGVGKYTASAIASFAYNLEYPVVDGNVIRVISRYFGITDAVDITQTQKDIDQLAHQLMSGSNPSDYNQAIMDFGALHCTPRNPNCHKCPFSNECVAFVSNLVDVIPFKSKKIKKIDRHLHYLYISDNQGNTIVNYRDKKDIWKSLYDFPSIEKENGKPLDSKSITEFLNTEIGANPNTLSQPTRNYKHVLSHQNIFAQFYIIKYDRLPAEIASYQKVSSKKLSTLAFPVLITRFLRDQEEWTLF